MKPIYTAIAGVVAVVATTSCQRPISDPQEFIRLCGPQPTQAQAEDSVRGWVKSEFSNHESCVIENVKVVGRSDRRFGLMNLGDRKYGWKITFYVKNPNIQAKYTGISDMLWNNGSYTIGNDGY